MDLENMKMKIGEMLLALYMDVMLNVYNTIRICSINILYQGCFTGQDRVRIFVLLLEPCF